MILKMFQKSQNYKFIEIILSTLYEPKLEKKSSVHIFSQYRAGSEAWNIVSTEKYVKKDNPFSLQTLLHFLVQVANIITLFCIFATIFISFYNIFSPNHWMLTEQYCRINLCSSTKVQNCFCYIMSLCSECTPIYPLL